MSQKVVTKANLWKFTQFGGLKVGLKSPPYQESSSVSVIRLPRNPPMLGIILATMHTRIGVLYQTIAVRRKWVTEKVERKIFYRLRRDFTPRKKSYVNVNIGVWIGRRCVMLALVVHINCVIILIEVKQIISRELRFFSRQQNQVFSKMPIWLRENFRWKKFFFFKGNDWDIAYSRWWQALSCSTLLNRQITTCLR